eukprot:gene9992-biopygen9296
MRTGRGPDAVRSIVFEETNAVRPIVFEETDAVRPIVFEETDADRTRTGPGQSRLSLWDARVTWDPPGLPREARCGARRRRPNRRCRGKRLRARPGRSSSPPSSFLVVGVLVGAATAVAVAVAVVAVWLVPLLLSAKIASNASQSKRRAAILHTTPCTCTSPSGPSGRTPRRLPARRSRYPRRGTGGARRGTVDCPNTSIQGGTPLAVQTHLSRATTSSAHTRPPQSGEQPSDRCQKRGCR